MKAIRLFIKERIKRNLDTAQKIIVYSFLYNIKNSKEI